MVSFLHTADLHLGLRLTRFPPEVAKKIREARFQALEKIRDLARTRQVDFVLVAGDLFDDHAVDSDLARRAFDMLESFAVPVLLISGNHDPLLPGSVWDRPPWNAPAPARVRLLREPKPVTVQSGVTLLPCPVFRKTSLQDPTTWITGVPCEDSAIRIGMAHGSLKARDNLPADDHLIARHAAHELKLDYLALGHWHSRRSYPDPAGVDRTAYCGVHEPMRFPGTADVRTGWMPYSSLQLQEFLDAGKGEILHVSIERPGVPPALEALEVGHLTWEDRAIAVSTEQDMARLIDETATTAGAERRILRLKLTGVLDAQAIRRVEHLREVLDRYLVGELDTAELHVLPTDDEVREIAGQGVLRRVLDRLRAEAADGDPASACVAERSILLLYQLAREGGE